MKGPLKVDNPILLIIQSKVTTWFDAPILFIEWMDSYLLIFVWFGHSGWHMLNILVHFW